LEKEEIMKSGYVDSLKRREEVLKHLGIVEKIP